MYFCLMQEDEGVSKEAMERLTGFADQLVAIGDYCIPFVVVSF